MFPSRLNLDRLAPREEEAEEEGGRLPLARTAEGPWAGNKEESLFSICSE